MPPLLTGLFYPSCSSMCFFYFNCIVGEYCPSFSHSTELVGPMNLISQLLASKSIRGSLLPPVGFCCVVFHCRPKHCTHLKHSTSFVTFLHSVDKSTDYPNYYQGLWDCTGDFSDELSFKRGDAIYILSKVWLRELYLSEVKYFCPF